MNERLLQFIWQFQYYNRQQLLTDEGEALEIIHPGVINRNQGPDFLNASVKIHRTIWAGNIELHVKASDWNKHHHSVDPNYKNVILHVVWENDISICHSSTLSLKERIPKLLLNRYEHLMAASLRQACKPFLPALTELGWLSWKERLVVERLGRKSQRIFQLVEETKQHWEEVFWRLLASNIGIKVNSDAFEAMAASLPVTVLAKHKSQIHQLEALMLGQTNLLNGTYNEDYPKMLQKEYSYLSKKHSLLKPTILPGFLRMRPANFPTVRLAQLAMLVNTSSHLFSKMKEMTEVNDVKSLLNVTANDYWHYHYMFDEETAYRPKRLGEQMVDNIIINTVAPILFAYGSFTNQEAFKIKAIHWLQDLSAERNYITKQWVAAEVMNQSAFDSQSLIELTNNYCNVQRCLECSVGYKILRNSDEVKESLKL